MRYIRRYSPQIKRGLNLEEGKTIYVIIAIGRGYKRIEYYTDSIEKAEEFCMNKGPLGEYYEYEEVDCWESEDE